MDGKKLLDGGTCDSVPITYSLLTGRKKHIVVLTQDATYEKGANKLMPVLSQMYADFPHYLERLRYRHVEYNRTYRQVARMHEAGEVFAIQPQRPVEVHSMEHDQDKLLDLYAQGYAEAAAHLGRSAGISGEITCLTPLTPPKEATCQPISSRFSLHA